MNTTQSCINLIHESWKIQYLLLAIPKQSIIAAGIAHKLALKECDVEDGSVVIDELQQVHFQSERIFKFRLSAEQLHFCKPQSDPLVQFVEYQNTDQVEACGSRRGEEHGITGHNRFAVKREGSKS